MSELAVILGLSGPKLTSAERVFFRDSNPWGFILFARNIETPGQVKRLTSDLRDCVGRECLIFIDQEGGRVQRLRPPYWNSYEPAKSFGALYTLDKAKGRRATYLNHRLIADDLRQIGVNADCAPVLDMPRGKADPIISDRAFGTEPGHVIDLAHAAMAGLMAGGVAPVVKHIPGHGRATVDSHKALPKIMTSIKDLEKTDFLPFQAFADAPMAMTAHAVYSDVSDEALTISPSAFKTIIRNTIGYQGLVMSDDLDMKALTGGLMTKTTRALDAGCDIALQCSGTLVDMVQVAKGARRLSGAAKMRADIALYCADHMTDFDRRETLHDLNALLAPRSADSVAA